MKYLITIQGGDKRVSLQNMLNFHDGLMNDVRGETIRISYIYSNRTFYAWFECGYELKYILARFEKLFQIANELWYCKRFKSFKVSGMQNFKR